MSLNGSNSVSNSEDLHAQYGYESGLFLPTNMYKRPSTVHDKYEDQYQPGDRDNVELFPYVQGDQPPNLPPQLSLLAMKVICIKGGYWENVICW
jgi:hypothetical protein